MMLLVCNFLKILIECLHCVSRKKRDKTRLGPGRADPMFSSIIIFITGETPQRDQASRGLHTSAWPGVHHHGVCPVRVTEVNYYRTRQRSLH